MPASEQVLILFTAHMAQSVCHSTIRVYLSAVRHLHLSKGYSDPLSNASQLELVLRGVKREKRSANDERLPITPLVLQAILGVVQRDAASYTNIMMWAACCLGYFAFLRSGEFTVNEGFDPKRHLGVQDVAVNDCQKPSVISIHLKQSKTDQDGRGITLYVGCTAQAVCPIAAMLAYLVARNARFSSGPLFMQDDGSPLSRSALVLWLKSTLQAAGMESAHFSGHSFRIGAASTAAAKGIADSTIQSLGRWKSDSFKRYIRIPREELAAVSRRIAT